MLNENLGNNLDKARKEINEVDAEIAKLFERRMRACAQVAEYKKEHGLAIKDPEREKTLIEKSRAHIKDPELESYYVQLQQKMIELSCSYQETIIFDDKDDSK